MSKKTLLLILLVALVVAAGAFVGILGWRGIAEVEVSGHGILALVLGAGLSLAMGAGLMFLVFFSSRRGHDDEAGRRD